LTVDLHKYQDFVKTVTSSTTENVEELITRLRQLSKEDSLNISLLMNAGTGLASEGGEFNEIVKKIVYQGKPYTEAERWHMSRELGDIFWYWVNACRALNYDPNDVIAGNVDKLKSRYPGGEFNVHQSENRQPGDL
jgi:uncharacterized protein YabN with tetrapyrrole methylase and pyrophosphatase domain